MSFFRTYNAMYLSYYDLASKPFQISTDPQFLWLGEKHKEALATLKYGIIDNKGFLLLTGDVGTGKTTLINALVNSLGDNIIVAKVTDPELEKQEFFNFIANAFNFKKIFQDKGTFLVHLSNFLHFAYTKNKKVLLIIDEAQRLNHSLLEEIRLLSNIEKQDTKLINIFFIGQNEFNDILLKEKNRALRQRITLNYNINPLTENETGEYIKHRLNVAGTQKKIFSSGAIRETFSFSRGYPRLINIICDLALLTGYAREKKKIKSGIIIECAQELQISSQTRPATEIRQETLIDIKNETAVETPKKSAGKTVRYIGVSALLLIIAGYLYYPTGYDPYVIKTKQFFSHFINSIQNVKPDNPPRTMEITSADSVAKYSKNSDDHSRQEKYLIPQENKTSTIKVQDLISQKNNTPTINVKETLNNDIPDKNNKALTIPEERDSDKKLSEHRNLQNSDNKPNFHPILDEKLIINFAYNSNDLPKDAYEKLNRLAANMILYPDTSILVKGYTDTSGRYIYNKKLSEFRANIVKSYLAGKGVNPLAIKAFGMGPVTTVKTGEIEKGIHSDRRVEIEIISSRKKYQPE
ncbi:MAG: AAA family ATPase [Deltaproteobacteria bacterium]|nr:AAA family ATPase [Deltaproteobacteria bacterium]